MRRLAPLTAILVLAAAGCGNDDEATHRTVKVSSGDRVTVVAKEYSFDPDTIVVTGGGKLTLELDNQGTLAHNIRVLDAGKDVGGTPTFSGGEPRGGPIKLEPGEYELLCTVGDHAELGMKGKLEVK